MAGAEHVLTVQRSRFHAVVARAADVERACTFVDDRRRALRKARHHCWACRVRDAAGRLVEQARDDGEVGRPGHALLELLRHAELENVVVVVSRIYGGVKLGPGGVSRAVREAAQTALASWERSI